MLLGGVIVLSLLVGTTTEEASSADVLRLDDVWSRWTDVTTSVTLSSYISGEKSNFAAAHLLVGRDEMILVDTLGHKDETLRLIALAKSFHKKLTTVIISRSHPDQYAGIALIRDAFAEAEVLSSRAITDAVMHDAPEDLKRGRKRPNNGLPLQLPIVVMAPGHILRLDHARFVMMPMQLGPNEHALALYEPVLGVLVGSAATFNGVHPPHEHSEPAMYARAVCRLPTLTTPTRVLFGYGSPATLSELADACKYTERMSLALTSLQSTYPTFLLRAYDR